MKIIKRFFKRMFIVLYLEHTSLTLRFINISLYLLYSNLKFIRHELHIH